MEWRDARWVGYIAAALLWMVMIGICAYTLPAGAGGGSMVQQRLAAGDRLVRPPSASTERVHVYSGNNESAKVFWEAPVEGRVHLTIELPAGHPSVDEADSSDILAPVLPAD